jgi:Mn2+/Fe2+ NRAMP family transporter
MGPGIVWMALAQGTGELYFWPYFTAKFGALYLCLLIPACILQTPINLEIGRYTMLTGESVFKGFTRLGGGFGVFMWIFFGVNFVLIGGFASAGGTALAELIDWPGGWSGRERTLLWSYAMTAVFGTALFVGRRVYRMIERFMLVVAVTTALGLVAACAHPAILEWAPAFGEALVAPSTFPAPPGDVKDLDRFVTMICYSGLGGFWSLFYSYWLREKGYGMAGAPGRFEDTPENRERWGCWMRTLRIDNGVGILGNLLTTLLLALLAFAILLPQGKVPEGWRMAVEQGDFFGRLWGPGARLVFLFVSGCFLMDSWLGGVDAVSRVHAEMSCTYFEAARRRGPRFMYGVFIAVMVGVTWIVLPLRAPDEVLALTGVLSLYAVPIFSAAIWRMNRIHLGDLSPGWAGPGRLQRAAFAAVIGFYAVSAVYYTWVTMKLLKG